MDKSGKQLFGVTQFTIEYSHENAVSPEFEAVATAVFAALGFKLLRATPGIFGNDRELEFITKEYTHWGQTGETCDCGYCNLAADIAEAEEDGVDVFGE